MSVKSHFILPLRPNLMQVQLQNLHAVASYSVDKHITFAIPAFSLYKTEDGNKSVISYALIARAPGLAPHLRGHTIWVIRQSISSTTVAESEKTALPVRSFCPRDSMTFADIILD